MATVQVGGVCFADVAAGYAAACAAMPLSIIPVTSGWYSVECKSSSVSGLSVNYATKASTGCPGSGCTWVNNLQTIVPTLQPCIETDYTSASLLLVGAFIAAWAPAYCLWRIYKFIMYSRGDPA